MRSGGFRHRISGREWCDGLGRSSSSSSTRCPGASSTTTWPGDPMERSRRCSAGPPSTRPSPPTRPCPPWKTWPSVHRGVPDERHLIGDLGQDHAAADEGEPRSGSCSTSGARGWAWVARCTPRRRRPTWGPPLSYLPDAFAADERAHPPVLSTFQAFNLAMTRRSARNVDSSVSWSRAARLFASSRGSRHPCHDVPGPRGPARRRTEIGPVDARDGATFQAVLAFDVFMAQLERRQAQPQHLLQQPRGVGDPPVLGCDVPDRLRRAGPGRRLDDEAHAEEIPWAMDQAESHAREARRVRRRPPGVPGLDGVEHGPAAPGAGPGGWRRASAASSTWGPSCGAWAGMPDGCWEARPAMLPQTNVVVHGALASSVRTAS